MNCLHSTATIILKVNGRVKTASSTGRYRPNCGNEWMASPSHFAELLSAVNGFVVILGTPYYRITRVYRQFELAVINNKN